MKAAAISTLYCFTLVLVRTMLLSATWIGAASPKEKEEPKRKSFQILVNCQITVTTMIGDDIGSSTLKKILKNPAPSIRADLMISSEIET